MERRAERNETERYGTKREWNGTERIGTEGNGTEHTGKERNLKSQRNATLRGLVHTCLRSLKWDFRQSEAKSVCYACLYFFHIKRIWTNWPSPLYSSPPPLLDPPHGSAEAKNLKIHLTLTLTWAVVFSSCHPPRFSKGFIKCDSQ